MNDRLRALRQPDTTVTPVPVATALAAADDDVEGEEEEGCCGWLRGVRDRALALEYRRLAGRGPWPAPDYALLKHRWWNEDGSFAAEYVSGLKVTVRGWGLRRVYELFLRNRVTYLQEQGADPVREKQTRQDPKGSWVRAIEVELPEEIDADH